MCLGVPGKVLEVDGMVATVDFFGVRKQVRLDIVDVPVAPGDYVLNHVGFAIHRIPDDEIGETLALFDTILKDARENDLMAADVRGEIAAASGPSGGPSGSPSGSPSGVSKEAGRGRPE